ncbi:MAG: hypothetical protein WDN04_23515 [Rhodospirillales bacterium]
MTRDWSAADYAANARFVADLGAGVLGLLAPRPGSAFWIWGAAMAR